MEDRYRKTQPEKDFEYRSGRLEEFTAAAERVKKHIESLRENVREMKQEYEITKDSAQKGELKKRIGLHEDSLAVNEERLKDFEEIIAHWDKARQQSARGILEDFDPDKDKPN